MTTKTSNKSSPMAIVKDAAKKAAVKGGKPRKAAATASDASGASDRIDAKIAELGDWRGTRIAEIRKLIHQVNPEVVEDWKWMGTPVWSHDGMYALANAHKDKVKVTFVHGAKLADPKKLFNAGLDGNKWRAIDLREGQRIDEAAFKALLREAIAYNTESSVSKKRGARADRLTKTAAMKSVPKETTASETVAKTRAAAKKRRATEDAS
jgi:hypothetical protein